MPMTPRIDSTHGPELITPAYAYARTSPHRLCRSRSLRSSKPMPAIFLEDVLVDVAVGRQHPVAPVARVNARLGRLSRRRPRTRIAQQFNDGARRLLWRSDRRDETGHARPISVATLALDELAAATDVGRDARHARRER